MVEEDERGSKTMQNAIKMLANEGSIKSGERIVAISGSRLLQMGGATSTIRLYRLEPDEQYQEQSETDSNIFCARFNGRDSSPRYESKAYEHNLGSDWTSSSIANLALGAYATGQVPAAVEDAVATKVKTTFVKTHFVQK